MLGVGRLGGILGLLVGGALLPLGFSFETVFAVLAVPALIAAGAIGMNVLRCASSPVPWPMPEC